jgi:endoglucanase
MSVLSACGTDIGLDRKNTPVSQLGVRNTNRFTLLLTAHKGSDDAYCGTGKTSEACYTALNPNDGAQWVTLGSARAWMQLDYNVCDGMDYNGATPRCQTYIGHVGVSITPSSTTLNALDGGTAALSAFEAGKPFDVRFTENAPPYIYPSEPSRYTTMPYRGVNLAGAEYNYGFQPPSLDDGAYYASLGMNTVRLPVKWEYLQSPSSKITERSKAPDAPIDFDNPNAKAYAALVDGYLKKGLTVIIDMHNYMRYGPDNKIIGGGDPAAPSAADFAAAWGAIAERFKHEPRVIFDLMNEPHEMSTQTILDNYNAALLTIRDAGAKNLVLLEGNGWSGAHSWASPAVDRDVPPRSNAQAFFPGAIHDPADHYALSVHQYFDADHSGTKEECVSDYRPDITALTAYLRGNHLQAIVTELGGPDTANCAADIDQFLAALDPTLYTGWTGWTGGRNSRSQLDYFGPLTHGDTKTMTNGFQPHLQLPSERQ